jgi:hypothetical protein
MGAYVPQPGDMVKSNARLPMKAGAGFSVRGETGADDPGLAVQGAVPQFALTLLRRDRGGDHSGFHERDLGDHLSGRGHD